MPVAGFVGLEARPTRIENTFKKHYKHCQQVFSHSCRACPRLRGGRISESDLWTGLETCPTRGRYDDVER